MGERPAGIGQQLTKRSVAPLKWSLPAVKNLVRSVDGPMSLLHFRCKERRRTLRVNLSVPLSVHGETDEGAKFCTHTVSQSINQHGAMMEMTEVVLVGQVLHLVNENSNRKVDCRVVSVQRKRDGKTYIGVEFLTAETNFWHMTFPMPGQKPLRKIVSAAKVTA